MGITKTDPSRYGSLRSSSQPQGAPPQFTPPQAARPQEAPHAATLCFRTAEPIPYREQDRDAGLALDLSLTCEGECDWRVCDDAAFRKNRLPDAELNENLERELCLALNIALTKLSSAGVPYAELPGRSDEIGASLAEDLFPLWRERLGIQAIRFRLLSAAPQKGEAERLAELKLEAKMSEVETAAQALEQEAQQAAFTLTLPDALPGGGDEIPE